MAISPGDCHTLRSGHNTSVREGERPREPLLLHTVPHLRQAEHSMTPKPTTMDVTLGGTRLTIPIYHDVEATHALIDKINRRLADIERQSTRIDTQAFALQLALAYAMEAEDLHRQHDADNKAVAVTLDLLQDQVRELINALAEDLD